MQKNAPIRFLGLLLCVGTVHAVGCAGKIVPGKDTSFANGADGGSDPSEDPSSDGGSDDDVRDGGGDTVASGSGGGAASAGKDAGGSSPAKDAGLVPLFVAVGEMGRTTVSCDDGNTWVADHSVREDPCSGSECDHSEYANSGLVYSSEGHRWFSTRGWGYDGPLEYTEDGQTWTTSPQKGRWNGIVSGAGTLYIQSSPPLTSDDQGMSFQPQMPLEFGGFVRGTLYYADDKFWLLSDDGDIFMSRDKARTWTKPKAKESRCSKGWQMNQGGLAAGNGTIVMVSSGQGVVCRSTDHGETFAYVKQFSENTASPLFFAQNQFWVWSGNMLHRSSDGMTWEDVQVDNLTDLRPTAYNPDSRVWVAAQGVYGDQKFGRSKDGIHWDVLPMSNFKKSHRVRMIMFGYGKKPTDCPR